MFAAYQKKLPGFRETQLLAVIPATTKFTANVAGSWYRSRHEVQEGTEVLIEYRRRDASGGFGESVEYLMFIASSTAPLYQLRIDLPEHHNAAVPNLHFEGRFDIVNEDKMLSPIAVTQWKDFFGLDNDFNVSDVLDPNQEERIWKEIMLEGRVRTATSKTLIETTDTGKRRVRIRRTRNIRTK